MRGLWVTAMLKKGVFWALHTRHLQNGTAPPGLKHYICFFYQKMIKFLSVISMVNMWYAVACEWREFPLVRECIYSNIILKNNGLKARSYFSKFSFLFHLKNHCSKDVKFQISAETVKSFGCTKQFCILQLPIPYCVS